MRTRMVIGVLLCLIGAVWVGQGLDVLGGSGMSGHAIWAVIGGVAFLFGVTLLLGARRGRDEPVDHG